MEKLENLTWRGRTFVYFNDTWLLDDEIHFSRIKTFNATFSEIRGGFFILFYIFWGPQTLRKAAARRVPSLRLMRE